MDYHSDRFKDNSILCFKRDSLVGVCPAHRLNSELRSHWGLTYGGFLWSVELKDQESILITKELMGFLSRQGIDSIRIKGIPEFYLGDSTQAKNNLLFAEITSYQSEPVFAIDYSQDLDIHKTKLKHYRKGHEKGFEMERTSDFSNFWNSVLIPRLASKHKTRPVHSLEEISLLASRFPNNIIQYNIKLEGDILAGITIFDKGKVVKSQYGATTDHGQKQRALEYLFLHLIYKYRAEGKSFFSMGTIGDDRFPNGINPGLKKQKEELGCREFHQHFYTFKL